jgi:hypothetical protein
MAARRVADTLDLDLELGRSGNGGSSCSFPLDDLREAVAPFYGQC